MRNPLSTNVYDAVYSLGQWCATALVLKKHGLRSSSGPFDWLLGQDVELSVYAKMICSGFKGFLSESSLRCVGRNEAEHHIHYRCDRTGLSFLHDFTIGRTFLEEYPEVRAKYARRILRLLTLLSTDSRILFVHFCGEGHYCESQLVDALSTLRIRFPNAHIDLLVLECEKDVTLLKTSEISSGLFRVIGDFYDRSRFDAVIGNRQLLDSVFKHVRMHGRIRNRFRLILDSYRRRVGRLLHGKTQSSIIPA